MKFRRLPAEGMKLTQGAALCLEAWTTTNAQWKSSRKHFYKSYVLAILVPVRSGDQKSVQVNATIA